MAQRNARDPADVAQAKRRADAAAQQALADLRAVLATAEGRRLLWRVLGRAGVYRSSFTGNSETFFREGERNVGLWLNAEVIAASPAHYLTMQREAIEADAREAAEIEAAQQKEASDE